MRFLCKTRTSTKRIFRFFTVSLSLICSQQIIYAQRIAIIGDDHGSGITGSFVTKYLIDLYLTNNDDDDVCSSNRFQSLTLFDPTTLTELTKTEDKMTRQDIQKQQQQRQQHGRNWILSYPLQFHETKPKIVVELGDHGIFSQTLSPLVMDMIKSGNLTLEKPIEIGYHSSSTVDRRINHNHNNHHGMMVHHGSGQIAFNVSNSVDVKAIQNAFLWRYNIDLYIVSRLASRIKNKFEEASVRLRNFQKDEYYYDSPTAIWQDVDIQGLLQVSMESLLDKYLVNNELSWIRQYILPGQGSFRQEILSSIVELLFHQSLSDVPALSGLLAYLIATDDNTYHIQGGTTELISTAWNLAKEAYNTKCPNNDIISHVSKQITTVVGSVYGFDLYDNDGEYIGMYDQVILAVPFSSSNVEFLIKSHMDETAVLQRMPLGGLIENNEEQETPVLALDHEGHAPLPRRLPAIVTRPYIEGVTTIVRNAVLQKEYWFSNEKSKNSVDWLPQQIYMTTEGKSIEYNVTGIFEIMSDPDDDMFIYKVCSSQRLSLEILQQFFGLQVKIEIEHIWNIGPNYQNDGNGITTNFMIYDGATGFHGHTKSGALYYPHAMDTTISTLESNAMGALAVAKLIAKRLEWIKPSASKSGIADEL